MDPTKPLDAVVTVNINQSCRLRLNDSGWRMWRDSLTRLNLDPEVYRPGLKEQDGWVTMPLWEAMHIFGPGCYMGPKPPFETTIEILP